MLKILKSHEWWEKRPRCPISDQCTGKIIKIKCKHTGQTVFSCSECGTYFVGDFIPTVDTPCIIGRWYNNMICVDEDSWELTEEDVTEEWDVEYYFKCIYNPFKIPHATKKISGDSGVVICPCCLDLTKIKSGKDVYGHSYEIKELKLNRLELIHIPKTGQKIQYCRFCNSIWPEYREPNAINYGGTIEIYLAMLGIIRFNDRCVCPNLD